MILQKLKDSQAHLRCELRSGDRPGARVPGLEMPWKPGTRPKWLKFIVIHSIFLRHPVLNPLVKLSISPSFLKIKIISQKSPSQECQGKKMGDGRESLMSDTNYNTPVKDLTYKDLLTTTFTQASHDRGMKTWSCLGVLPPVCFLREQVSVWIVHCKMTHGQGKICHVRTMMHCQD
jgi:hypothetical protein